MLDFRPEELDTRHSSVTTHKMSITHIATGVRVSGSGPNKYALECALLERLREKLRDREQLEKISCLQ